MKKELLKIGVTGMILSAALFTFSCGGGSNDSADDGEAPKSMVEEEKPVDPMENKGIGPISSVELSATIDVDLAATGEVVYNEKCTACHKPEVDYIGPAPKGVMTRRSPEWIMNMILNPEEMVINDPIAKALLIKFNGAPMANQNLTEDEARAVLEYFRTL